MRARMLLGALLVAAVPARAQQAPAPDTRAQIQALQYPPLRFNPPLPKRVTLSNGVPVYLLEDHALATALARNAHAHARAFAWPARGRALVDVLEEVR